MDQGKIGNFLKELRTEKGLTQEQLAEKLNVAARTVSRWETGRNLPDLSILVELAEFYDIDIREIISGERKSGEMKDEVKETLKKAADYSANDKNNILKEITKSTITGLIFWFIAIIAISIIDISGKPNVALNRIQYTALFFILFRMVTTLLYSTGKQAEIQKDKRKENIQLFVLLGIIIIGTVLLIILGFFK